MGERGGAGLQGTGGEGEYVLCVCLRERAERKAACRGLNFKRGKLV